MSFQIEALQLSKTKGNPKILNQLSSFMMHRYATIHDITNTDMIGKVFCVGCATIHDITNTDMIGKVFCVGWSITSAIYRNQKFH